MKVIQWVTFFYVKISKKLDVSKKSPHGGKKGCILVYQGE